MADGPCIVVVRLYTTALGSDDHMSLRRTVRMLGRHPLAIGVPDYREAVDFCIDRRPQLALKINGGRLPFACHGVNKRNVRRFWQPILTAAENAPP